MVRFLPKTISAKGSLCVAAAAQSDLSNRAKALRCLTTAVRLPPPNKEIATIWPRVKSHLESQLGARRQGHRANHFDKVLGNVEPFAICCR